MSSRWIVAADDVTVLSKAYEERFNATSNARHRQIIGTLLEHIRTEAACDLDGVMATLSPEPIFHHWWGYPNESGARGYDAVRARYAAMFERGGLGNMRMTTHRFVVDDDATYDQFTITRIVPWWMAKESGYEIDDESGHYAVHHDLVAVVPYDADGLMIGELSYGSSHDPRAWDRVPEQELTAGYRAWQERFAPSAAR